MMSNMRDSLERIRSTKYLAVSKKRYGNEMPESLRADAIEEANYWLIPCSHLLGAPATEAELAACDTELGLSEQLGDLLRLANGAELFRLHYKPAGFADYWVGRYKILSVAALHRVNRMILESFMSFAEDDPQYQDIHTLDYRAFCDVGDGNYLAISLQNDSYGTIFFLDHEYSFYPISDVTTREAYTRIAFSIEEWLEQLVQSMGEGGMANHFIPL